MACPANFPVSPRRSPLLSYATYLNGTAAQTAYASGPSDAFAGRPDFAASGTYAACVLNGPSFAAGNTSSCPLGTVAPGEIVSIFGSIIQGPIVRPHHDACCRRRSRLFTAS